jgi:hypothetical protein
MDTRMKLTKQVLAAAMAVGIAAAGGTAFTASNTTPDTAVGQTAQAVSGYTITAVVYGMDATAGSEDKVKTVTFDANPAIGVPDDGVTATAAKFRLTGSGAFTACDTPTASPNGAGFIKKVTIVCSLGSSSILASAVTKLDLIVVGGATVI